MQIKLIERNLSESRTTFEMHMHRDFPESEIKPWEITKSLYEKGIYEFFDVFSDGKMVGYVWIVSPEGGVALIDYLAVLPQYRGTGVGSKILKELCARYARMGKTLILESEYPDEAPNPQVAERRLGFYARAGFMDSGVQVRLFGVRFCILAHGIRGREKEDLACIYRSMFPCGLYEKAVVFLN